MLQQKITLGGFAAVHAFVVLEDVFDVVNLHRVVPFDLATVTANDFHAEPTGNHLALVAIFVTLIFGDVT